MPEENCPVFIACLFKKDQKCFIDKVSSHPHITIRCHYRKIEPQKKIGSKMRVAKNDLDAFRTRRPISKIPS